MQPLVCVCVHACELYVQLHSPVFPVFLLHSVVQLEALNMQWYFAFLTCIGSAFLTMATSLEPVHRVNWPVGSFVASCLIFNGSTQ